MVETQSALLSYLCVCVCVCMRLSMCMCVSVCVYVCGLVLQLVLVQMVDVQLLASGGQDLLLLLSLSLFLASSLLVGLFSVTKQQNVTKYIYLSTLLLTTFRGKYHTFTPLCLFNIKYFYTGEDNITSFAEVIAENVTKYKSSSENNLNIDTSSWVFSPFWRNIVLFTWALVNNEYFYLWNFTYLNSVDYV